MKSTKKTLIALAITAALGASGAANAGVLASSTFSITNFLLSNNDTGTTLALSDFGSPPALAANNNALISSSLAGLPVAGNSFNLSIFDPTPTDLTRVTVGDIAIAPAENNFMVLTPPPSTGNFANADQLLTGTAINLGGGTTGANAQVRSDVSLTGTGSGAAASNVGLNATFRFALANDTNVRINFDGAVDLVAFTDLGINFPSNAQASSSIEVILNVLNGGQVFAFNGATAQGLNTGCTLGNTRTTNAPANGLNSYRCSDTFSATTGLLTAGTTYELSIRQTTGANARLVSEPGVLSLMGLGLLGIGAALRKRKAA